MKKILVVLALLASACGNVAFAQIYDKAPHPVVPMVRPAYLTPVVDPVFGSKITRITDSLPATAGASSSAQIGGILSTWTPMW